MSLSSMSSALMQFPCRQLRPAALNGVHLTAHNIHLPVPVRLTSVCVDAPTLLRHHQPSANALDRSVAVSQPAIKDLKAESSNDGANGLGPHGPKLPQRPLQPKTNDLTRIDAKKRQSENGGGGKGPGGVEASTLPPLLAYSGLIGTAAVVLGNFAGLDLWGDFNWSSLNDLRLAAAVSVPLQLLNAALLLPDYGKPLRMPDFINLEAYEAKLRNEQRRLLAAQEGSSAAAVVAPAATSSQAGPATSDATPLPSTDAATLPASGLSPADEWGRRGASSSSSSSKPAEDGWTALRSCLHIAQGYYITNNPTARLPAGVEAGYSAVDAISAELMYRGVMLTWLASWMADRLYESSLDEFLAHDLPSSSAALGLTGLSDSLSALGVHGLCECVLAAATSGYVVWAVMSRAWKAARRLEIIMKVAAESTASAAGKASGGASTSGNKAPAGVSSGTTPAISSPDASTRVTFGPVGPSLGSSNAGSVMLKAAGIQAARDALQILAINGVFIATGGNLAASYAVSVVNQLLISAMQRHGVRRARERSAALAREVKAYNAEMQRIAAKYRDQVPRAAAAAARMDAAAAASSAAVASTGQSEVVVPAGSEISDTSDTAERNIPPNTPTSSDSGTVSHALAVLDTLVPDKHEPRSQERRQQTPRLQPQPQRAVTQQRRKL